MEEVGLQTLESRWDEVHVSGDIPMEVYRALNTWEYPLVYDCSAGRQGALILWVND